MCSWGHITRSLIKAMLDWVLLRELIHPKQRHPLKQPLHQQVLRLPPRQRPLQQEQQPQPCQQLQPRQQPQPRQQLPLRQQPVNRQVARQRARLQPRLHQHQLGHKNKRLLNQKQRLLALLSCFLAQ